MKEQIITSIKLKLNNVEVELTPEQAKDLQAVLNDLLGAKPEKETVYIQPYWYPQWSYEPHKIIWGTTLGQYSDNGTVNLSIQ